MATSAQTIIDAIDDAIAANIDSGELSTDGRTVKWRSLAELIEARRHYANLLAQQAMAVTTTRPAIYMGIRLGRAP